MERPFLMRARCGLLLQASSLALCWVLISGAAIGHPGARKAEKARKLYEQGEYEEALKLYRDVQVENPDSPLLHFNVGGALYKAGDYEAALKEYEQALHAGEERWRSQALYNQGNAHFQQHQFEQAVEAYINALQADPTDMDAKVNLELALEMLQQQPEQDRQQEGQEHAEPEDQKPQDSPPSEQDSRDHQQAHELQQQPGDDEQEEPRQPTDQRREGMSAEEAERLLEALQDREKQAQLRRLQGAETVQGEDW